MAGLIILLVAPFTGAWIEIDGRIRESSRGAVAPFTGAWIEIPAASDDGGGLPVAPFTGAWIEIVVVFTVFVVMAGRSLHGSVD